MISRIEIYSIIDDTRALVRKDRLIKSGSLDSLANLFIADVYTVTKRFTWKELKKIASVLSNPVIQKAVIRQEETQEQFFLPDKFRYALEIGFLPGVTDNVANTAREIIEDLFKKNFSDGEAVYSSQITFIEGNISQKDIKSIALSLHNPLIARSHIKNYSQYLKDQGMDFVVPKVKLRRCPEVIEVNLNVSDQELQRIGKQGIVNSDGTRRGPLALDLYFMKTIKDYFNKLERNPTDIELESLAQTWSEHCKHTIFADPIDEVKNGIFNTFIKKATDEIRRKKGNHDKCTSVFHDNSGAVEFDDNYLVTHKVETHNSPSAMDPFGGAVTGIVGVNRDTIGFGLGAKPVANIYGFCFADPRVDKILYKGENFTQKMLSSRRIMDGVIEGVNAGGNQSGIPTPCGFLYFDERYRGKPLVFVGTLGIIPKKIKNKKSYEKKAMPGDYIVMIGGRVGKDGIHGATFSSEALDSGSPVSAVQIGDPITQKKLSDTLYREARDMLLYNSITDNGAGGLSCSVSEMAKESNGCLVDLEKVPLKYPGLDPWEIWVSESQERMTLAIPAANLPKFLNLMKKRGVEATVIGKFTKKGKCIVRLQGKVIMDVDLQFLHYGLPQRPMKTKKKTIINEELQIKNKINLTEDFLTMMGRVNIASYEFITTQYDHMVQANLVLSPLQGRGRVNSNISVIKPVLFSNKGIVLSYGLYPLYSDIDTYHMAASSIDTAVRNIVAAGGDLNEIYLLDNFCWCSGFDNFRLWQLKRAAQACYRYAKIYGTPFISGKDSMFNDFIGYDKSGNPVKISIPPTLLITSFGIIKDVAKVISCEAKVAGDLVYILGETCNELGGSEYYSLISEKLKGNYLGNIVPKVDALTNVKLYKAYQNAAESGLISSAISIDRGGLAVALAKTAMAGKLGLTVSLAQIPGKVMRNTDALFSESQGRILVTISPDSRSRFEKIFKKQNYNFIGQITNEPNIIIKGLDDRVVVKTTVKQALNFYKFTFKDY